MIHLCLSENTDSLIKKQQRTVRKRQHLLFLFLNQVRSAVRTAGRRNVNFAFAERTYFGGLRFFAVFLQLAKNLVHGPHQTKQDEGHDEEIDERGKK